MQDNQDCHIMRIWIQPDIPCNYCSSTETCIGLTAFLENMHFMLTVRNFSTFISLKKGIETFHTLFLEFSDWKCFCYSVTQYCNTWMQVFSFLHYISIRRQTFMPLLQAISLLGLDELSANHLYTSNQPANNLAQLTRTDVKCLLSNSFCNFFFTDCSLIFKSASSRWWWN